LCGAVSPSPSHVAQPGDPVAAKVTGRRSVEWILASVIQFFPEKNKYEVEDEDPGEEEDPLMKKRFLVSSKNIIFLPTKLPETWTASTEFPKGTFVLAMFPDTTSFYRAIVDQPPRKRAKHDYLLIFDDEEEMEDGKPKPRTVLPEHVVAFPRIG